MSAWLGLHYSVGVFYSDNTAPAHPAILEAIVRANVGHEPSYGVEAATEAVRRRFQEVFEANCEVALVANGTAANALAIAALTPPWGAVMCHRDAHLATMESGAPEFFSGATLLPQLGEAGLLSAQTIGDCLAERPRSIHVTPPTAVSISQTSEYGTIYSLEALGEIGAICKAHDLKFHMDGARLANALATSGATPAEMTWKQGVDAISFGVTKNGGLACEAVVCFDKAAAAVLPRLRKRSGHLWAKHRYLSTQMLAYLENDNWLKWASHANTSAARLARILGEAGGQALYPVQSNAVFFRLPPAVAVKLKVVLGDLHGWPPAGADVYRFVASWDTSEDDLRGIADALGVNYTP